jgi:Bacterial Ig-like domain
MRLLPQSPTPGRLIKPAQWSRALLAASFASICLVNRIEAQTYFNLATGNYSENFSTINAPWPALTAAGNASSNSFSGLAIDATGTIPSATRITTASLAYSTGSTGGVQIGTGNIQLLSTGGNPGNTSSTGIDLNLNFLGRANGNLSFDAATVFNNTGDRLGTLRVYFSTNGTSWTEITGTNLPYVATNNVPGSATINVPIPAAVNGNNQVKLRFYYHNGPNGTTGSRPKISIDNVAVTSLPDGSGDTTPPQIATLSPTNGATAVLRDTNVVATFNELVQAGTGTILLQKTSNTETVLAAVTISGTTLTIDPTADLEYNTNYNVIIPPGSIKDIANNNFNGVPETGAWAFTTIQQDLTDPAIVSVSPTGLGVASTSTLTVTFSEDINPAGGNITLFKAGGVEVETIPVTGFPPGATVSGAVATIPLTNPLEFGVSYYVQIAEDAFEDTSGNGFPGILAPDTTTWSFTTVDVPVLQAATPYTQTFASYVSASTLPLGWSFSGSPGFTSDYRATWGTVTPNPSGGTFGGFLGNASVFGYHHTSTSGTVAPGMNQILTLRNGTGSPISNLTVTYKGRVNVVANTRIPVFAVSVDGIPAPALTYSTADSDNSQRNASIALTNPVPVGATFQIIWNSSYATGSGSARQIGISDVFVSAGATFFAPTVATLSVPVATIGSVSATAQAEVTSDGGQTVIRRGFVYNLTSAGTLPEINGPGVTNAQDTSSGVGVFALPLEGLTANTGYTVRAYAENSTGISYTPLVSFTTLAPSPVLTGIYRQAFESYNGTNPAGWTAISDAVPPVQNFVGAWGTQAVTGGFLGSNPPDAGVLGYRHTGNTGNLTVTLRLINGTNATLTSLNVGYRGRVNDTEETRTPAWAVSVNGSPAIPALAYSTAGNVDVNLATTVTGLNIAAGAEFTIRWVSNRGESAGSSKQIGIGAVSVSTPDYVQPTLASWISGFNVGGETGVNGDFDKDGLSNAVENILGSDPSLSNAGISTVSASPTSLVFRHNRSKEPASDLTPSYEWSTNLATWYPAGAGGGITVSITPVIITPGATTDLVQVTAAVTNGTATRLFARLKVTNP